MRIWADFEIEVIDPTASRTFTFDVGTDIDGNVGMNPYDTDEDCVSAAVRQVIFQALGHAPAGAGFRWLSGSSGHFIPDGDNYAAITLSAMPRRRGDGSIPGLP